MSYQEKIFGRTPKENKPQITNEASAAMGGGSHITERRPEQIQKEEQLCNGFDTLLKKLKQTPGELEDCIERLRSLPDCDNILEKLSPYFTIEHWEMLAVLEAYDKQTFDHSLRVAAFVYGMTNEGGETEAYMKMRVGAEQGSLGELFTAALFHDIGKTAIPCDILHDNHSRREWGKRANDWAIKNGHDQHFDPNKLEFLEEVELDHYFMKVHAINKADPLDIVPLEEIFSPEILAELEQHGISPHDTFREVLECHEGATGAILRRKKMYTASDIASHHHDYEHRPIQSERYPTETSAIRLGFELSILRSMDVYDALTSNDRSYKESYHPFLALEILIKEARAEFTEPELTKYVIRDLYKKVEASQKNTPRNEKEKRALSVILEFIQ